MSHRQLRMQYAGDIECFLSSMNGPDGVEAQRVAPTLFAENGYKATSLQDIASEMGSTKPAVYYHYRGKQEILNDLAEPVRTVLSALLDRARSTLGPKRTEVLVTGLADLFLARHQFARIMAQQAAFRDAMRTAVGGPGMLDTLWQHRSARRSRRSVTIRKTN